VIIPNQFKPAKSLVKFGRKCGYSISLNLATAAVIEQCAAHRSAEETWLDQSMQTAYKALAKLKRCHSVEVWHNQALIGGLYGVQVGQMFCGESMFSRQSNASKIALWAFCQHFSRHGGQLIDCQVLNPHTQSLGAHEIDRDAFLAQLAQLKASQVQDHCFDAQWLTI
jgi:leucyl/phenylalanyl-tRNA--protein transferase